MAPRLATGRLKWLLLAVLALIWGSSFILIKRGLFHEGRPVLSPMQVASARIFVAWLVLLPFVFRYWRSFGPHWKALVAIGLLENALPAFLFAFAQSRIDSTLSGILNSLSPLFTLVVGVLFFGIRTRWAQVFGVALGLVGAVGILGFRVGDGLGMWNIYVLLPVLGALSYGIGVNVLKSWLYMMPALAITALAITTVGPIGLVGIIVSDLPATLSSDPQAWCSLGYVTILAVVSTGIALILWNELIKWTSALWASSVTYLIPIVAIGWGLLDGERLMPLQVVMVAVVMAGIYLVNAADER